jgi:phosphotransferase system enzyme I (PtsI)
LGHDNDSAARRERDGDAVSPGVGIGPAYVVDRRHVHVPHRHLDKSEVEDEQGRFRAALRQAQEQLEGIKSKLPHGEHRQILKAQQMMLRDPHLLSRTDTLIRDELINAEWAISNAVDEIRDTLGKASDEYFRERQFDVAFMGERILQNLGGDHPGEIIPPEGSVVVAHDLSPADTAQLHRCRVAGIVTEEGGQTSHSAIMARALEIPAVVGVDNVIGQVETGDVVIVDGIRGQVLIRPRQGTIDEYHVEVDRYQAFETKILKQRALPAITNDGLHIDIRANLALDEEVESARKFGAEGVGLYRTEFLYMNREQLPTEEDHYRAAKAVLRRCAPHPVVMRTFDLGSDKQCRFFEPDEPEANPALGMRSLRLALRERDVFLTQLRGLLRAGLHGPLRIMLPLVSSLRELKAGLKAVAEARHQLEESGMAYEADVPVGIMIEVPAAAIIADVLADHVDFMSIGTNDLIQYTLAIDRESDDVNYLYQPLHPAIIRLIQNVCAAAARAKIPVSLCGEMAADPRFTWVLVGLGIREMSMHPAAIPIIKSIIRSSSSAEMRSLADQIVGTTTAAEARKIVNTEMQARFPEHLEHGAGGRKDSDGSPS